MTRTVNATTLTALQSDEVRLAHLLELDFDTTIPLTDAPFDITFGNWTYQALGHFLSLTTVKESQSLRVGSMTINISGVEQSYVSLFLNQQYVNRRVIVYLAILNGQGVIQGDPIKTFDGEVTGYSLQDSAETCTINMNVASHWSDFERINGRRTNQNSQQYHFPNDTGMRFAAESVRDIRWGKA